MSYKIVGDSCCDVTQQMKEDMNIEIAPLTIELEGRRYVDDDTFNATEFVKSMNESDQIPKTSCPSPADYIEKFNTGEDESYVITLSSNLSGSYNSAKIAKDIYESENEDKKVHVFDSLSAAAGETVIALMIDSLSKSGKKFDEIVDIVSKYILEMKTLFVLDKIDNLEKTGRMSRVKAKIANVLNIKPVLSSNGNGEIIMINKARGINKALSKMIDEIGNTNNLEDKVLVITYCNCPDRANEVKQKVVAKYNFKDIHVIEMRGISSTYANDGGIVIAY
jgi:DegV family protein with EDD domain